MPTNNTQQIVFFELVQKLGRFTDTQLRVHVLTHLTEPADRKKFTTMSKDLNGPALHMLAARALLDLVMVQETPPTIPATPLAMIRSLGTNSKPIAVPLPEPSTYKEIIQQKPIQIAEPTFIPEPMQPPTESGIPKHHRTAQLTITDALLALEEALIEVKRIAIATARQLDELKGKKT